MDGTDHYAECSRKKYVGLVQSTQDGTGARAGDDFFWGGSGKRIPRGYKLKIVVN